MNFLRALNSNSAAFSKDVTSLFTSTFKYGGLQCLHYSPLQFTSSNKEKINPSCFVAKTGQIRMLRYNDFGHRKQPVSRITSSWYAFIGIGLGVVLLCDVKSFFKMIQSAVSVDAETVCEPEVHNKVAENLEEQLETGISKKKVGFRERKIIEYENRIRQFSTPDKVFRYFATLQMIHPHGETEVFMTPDDFLRSITPGMKQPDGFGLDQFRRIDSKTTSKNFTLQLVEELQLEDDSIFLKLGSSGLISFSDYIFLLTLLSTSKRHFEIAFRMFDMNGDGDVDAEEFELAAQLLRQTTSVGARHRDHGNTGNTFKVVNSALSTYFFGPQHDKKLTIEKFLDFQLQLQQEILSLEFRRRDLQPDGTLSETGFADLLLAYAGYPAKKKSKMMKRVRKEYQDNNTGISQQDYLDFFTFLNNINDVDTALTFYHIAGASIEPGTLKHVARTVAHVELADHLIHVVFTIFDENQDGQLSNREFVLVMKNRLMRGLEKPKDTGFIKLIESAIKCAKQTRPVLLDF